MHPGSNPPLVCVVGLSIMHTGGGQAVCGSIGIQCTLIVRRGAGLLGFLQAAWLGGCLWEGRNCEDLRTHRTPCRRL